MSHTLLPVTQNDWCVLQHSQAFDREGKRRGNGRRGTAQSVTSVPYFWGTREKHTCTVQTLHIRFLPKTVVWRVACVKNVAWQHLHRVHTHRTGKITPSNNFALKRQKLLFSTFLTKKHMLSLTHSPKSTAERQFSSIYLHTVPLRHALLHPLMNTYRLTHTTTNRGG